MQRTRWTSLLACGALCAVVGWAGRAEATLCFQDMKGDGTGKALKWPKMPVQYYINASKVPAADQAAWKKAVQDAFATYQAIPCTSLTFEYKGDSTSVASVAGAILVVFSDVPTGYFYWGNTEGTQYDPPDITQALIQLNIKESKGTFGIGAKPNMIDIQTAVTQMIPWAVGFYAGTGDPKTGSLPAINYNVVTTTLTPEQIQGVQATYPKTGCTPQTIPLACAKAATPDGGPKPTTDGGPKPTTDGGPKPTTDGGPKPTTDGPKTTADRGPIKYNEAGQPIGGDGSTLPPKEDGSGCCRVSHASTGVGNVFLALAAGLIALGLLRRRRR